MNTMPPQSSLLTSDAALRWRTRDTSRHLIQGFIGAFAIAAVTGLLLWLPVGHGNLVQVLLLTHLTAGVMTVLFFIPFIVIHWRDGREPLMHLIWPFRLIREVRWDVYAGKRLIGHGFMWSLLIVVFSGLIIALPAIAYLAGYPLTLPYGGHVPLLKAHRWLTVPLLICLWWHLPKKDRS